MACPFCLIDEERQRILEEREYIYVMPSNPQLVPHHMLVIPKRHVEKPWQLTQEERAGLYQTIFEFQKKIVDFCAPWCDVQQHYRPYLPQSRYKVDHIHWHLLPRWFQDPLYQRVQIHEKKMFDEGMLSPDQMRRETQKLKRIFSIP